MSQKISGGDSVLAESVRESLQKFPKKCATTEIQEKETTPTILDDEEEDVDIQISRLQKRKSFENDLKVNVKIINDHYSIMWIR